MNEINIYKNLKAKKLFLVGFMATGKTTIGKLLSSKLNIPFFDSDKEIELSLGCSIKEYFDIHGESKFRLIEKKIIIDKVNNYKNNGFIMSLGGGAYLNSDVRQIINYVGTSIWLNGNIDIIYKRLKNSRNERPLLLTFNTKEKLEELLKDRTQYYKKADIKVDIIKTSKVNMANVILNKINEHFSLEND